MKIRTKLFLLTFIMVFVIVFMVLAMYARSSTVLTDVSVGDALGRVEEESYAIDVYFKGLARNIDSAVPGVSMLFDEEGKAPEEMLTTLLTLLSDTNDVHFYMGLADSGKFISGQNMQVPEDYDPRARPWYKDATAVNKTTITDPYEDIGTQEIVVTVATPAYTYGGSKKFLGVLAADVVISQLVTRVANTNIMGVGYGILIAPDGTFLQHPNKSYFMKENITKSSSNIPPELAAIGQKMLTGGARVGWDDFSEQGKKQRLFYSTSEAGFAVGVVISHSEIGTIVGRITMVLVVAGVVALTLMVTFMLFLIPTIVKPLLMVEKSLARIAGLDLSTDPDTERFESNVNAATEVGEMIDRKSVV